ncbi:MAG: hypothetical protein EHM58_07700 [Ignavibacteriae bacterium]|nr:MAG: hypothetical protein EHM58_07700 [Ignavibacteriota bacterium]
MNKLHYVIVLLVIVGFVFSGCSKKSADKLMGKWQATEFEDTTFKSMDIKVGYEFTKDTIINTATVHGDSMPMLKIGYVIKDTTLGDTLVLEATHPQSQQKGMFKITFDGSKMKLTDPGNTRMTLEKQ